MIVRDIKISIILASLLEEVFFMWNNIVEEKEYIPLGTI